LSLDSTGTLISQELNTKLFPATPVKVTTCQF